MHSQGKLGLQGRGKSTPAGDSVVALTRRVFSRASCGCLILAALLAFLSLVARALFGVVLISAEEALHVAAGAAVVLGATDQFARTGGIGATKAVGRWLVVVPGVAATLTGAGLVTSVFLSVQAGADTPGEAVLSGLLVVFAGWLCILGVAEAVAAWPRPDKSGPRAGGG